MTKSGAIQVTWAGAAPYTLTASYVASDEVIVNFAKKLTIYPYYSAGTGATTGQAQFYVELSPLNSSEDASNLYWAQTGIYTDSSGTWSKEEASYIVPQGTVGTYRSGVPLTLDPTNAYRLRIFVKENNAGSAAGAVRFWVNKNDNL